MKRSVTTYLVILSCFLLGCSHDDTSTDLSVVDRDKARGFADALVKDIIEDRTDSIYSKMEKRFRESVRREQIEPMLEHIYAAYGGKPIEAEFKTDETGIKTYLNGGKKTMRKLWYSVRTTEHQEETHFLFVEVVPEGNQLACTGFSIVTFPLGVPPHLK